MPKLMTNEAGHISVRYQTRLTQLSIEKHIEAESFVLENEFRGDLNALIPRCPSTHYGIKVVLFQLADRTSNDGLYAAYSELGLVPDPIAQIRVNGDFPEIPRDHPNVCQWTYRTSRDYLSPYLYIKKMGNDTIVKSKHATRDALWNPGTWFCGTRPVAERLFSK